MARIGFLEQYHSDFESVPREVLVTIAFAEEGQGLLRELTEQADLIRRFTFLALDLDTLEGELTMLNALVSHYNQVLNSCLKIRKFLYTETTRARENQDLKICYVKYVQEEYELFSTQLGYSLKRTELSLSTAEALITQIRGLITLIKFPSNEMLFQLVPRNYIASRVDTLAQVAANYRALFANILYHYNQLEPQSWVVKVMASHLYRQEET